MCVEVRHDKSGKDISGGSHMAVSTGAAGGTSDLEFISYYLNSDSDLMDSVKCDCLLSHSGIVKNEITGNDLFC